MPFLTSTLKTVFAAALTAAVLAATGTGANAPEAATAVPPEPQARFLGASEPLPPSRLIVAYDDDIAAFRGRRRTALSLAAAQALDARARSRVDDLAAGAGQPLRYRRRLGNGALLIDADGGLDEAALTRLAARIKARRPAGLRYVEPDRILQAVLTPNDPWLGNLWGVAGPAQVNGLAGVNAYTAWDRTDGSGAIVAVIDTGYRPHADLAGQVVAQYDFISDAASANDGDGRDANAQDPGDFRISGACGSSGTSNSSWHGSHVAGTIAALANNGVGVAGVAYGAKLVIARVLGRCGGTTSDIADAIIWASGGTVSGVPANPQPAQVLNMSLGGQYPCSSSPTLQGAIDSARSRNATVVVAAGNSNMDASGFSPASCSGVISVASMGDGGSRAPYSNYGASVDVAAPGGDMSRGSTVGILSTYNNGATTPGSDSYAYLQGTSMASPHVAGVAALLYAAQPSITPDQVETTLKGNVRSFPFSCSGCGTGLVDATLALAAITPGPGNLRFSAASYAVTENGVIATISVLRSGGDVGAVSVNYATANGTAIAGSDYIATNGTLNWADGDATTKTFSVPMIDDALAESSETLALALSAAGGGATLGSVSNATLTIADDDTAPGSLAFAAASYSLAENAGAVTVTISRTGGVYGAASLSYVTANSSATAGSDYLAANGTLSWANGDASSKIVRVTVYNDSTAEANESFQLRLSGVSGATLGTTSITTVTINDDDSPSVNGSLAFTAGSASISEAAGTATVSVSRTLGSTGAVSVNYASSNGTALAGSDYSAVNGSLSWAAGDTASKSFTVPISNDSAAEATETISLSLSTPGGGAVLGATKTETLSIIDNDGLPGVIAVGSASYTVAENAGSISIPVTRSGGSTGAASVTYATASSSAAAGSDFTAASGTLTWANGDAATKTVSITLFNDTLAESSESFQLRLGTVAGASLGSPATAVVTISDDDTISSAGSIAFVSGAQSVLENAGNAVINVARNAGSIGAVSVDYTITSGTATAASDYTAVSGTLNWANGASGNRAITLPVLNDALAEANETVVLSLSNATGGAVLGSAKTSTVTITDDDGSPGTLALSSATYTIGEAGGAATVTVTRSGGSYGTAAIDYTTANGLAMAGSDYTAKAGRLVWASGDAASKTFTVAILNDTLKENAETILIRLSNPQTATLGSLASGTVTIIDND
ncbi:MAG: Calx-beta domain-containing protein [Nevskia sp.]|nr:Calx-beta domain-containing protein [Nevskia sp.]